MPLERFLDRFVRDPFLRAILSIQAGDHGMAPSRAPAALHAGLQGYYFDGGCYPRGGGHAIPDALAHHIRLHGGEIFPATAVDRIAVHGRRALGVALADGTEVRARRIVSNADPGVTWGRLVDREHQPWHLRWRVDRLRYSVSTLSLFLAVDMDLRAAGLDSGNVWYSRTADIEASYRAADRGSLPDALGMPGLFFNVTTLKDASLRSDGLHTIEALALSTPRAFERWRGSSPGKRGADYTELKEAISQQILDEIERFVPGLRDQVVFRSLGTPLTNMSFLQASEGGIYGTEKTLGNLGPFGFPVRTHIDGLFQCGASTLAAGIHGVTRSGLAAAAAALECREDELLNAAGQTLRIHPAEDPAQWPAELRPSPRPAPPAAASA